MRGKTGYSNQEKLEQRVDGEQKWQMVRFAFEGDCLNGSKSYTMEFSTTGQYKRTTR